MICFVTKQQWEWRTPPALRLDGEGYWQQVELPLHVAAYIVNTLPDPKAHLPRRSIAVASIERLLEIHAELGEDGMESVYLLVRKDEEMGDVPWSGVGPQSRQVEIHMLSVALPTAEWTQYR